MLRDLFCIPSLTEQVRRATEPLAGAAGGGKTVRAGGGGGELPHGEWLTGHVAVRAGAEGLQAPV